jgi:hypothetical protein
VVYAETCTGDVRVTQNRDDAAQDTATPPQTLPGGAQTMGARRGATGQRLELGTKLRHLREHCPPVESGRAQGMTRKEAVRGIPGLSEATLGRIEIGELNFRRNIKGLKLLLRRYGVDDEEVVEHLLALNRDATDTWLNQYARFMPPGFPLYVGLEIEARRVLAYHPTVIHGLLQTREYAEALFEQERPIEDTTSAFTRAGVELRMERKRRVLERADIGVHVILGEAAVRTPVGDEKVMRGQYEEILNLARKDHISVQILPFRPGYRASHDFAVLDLGDLPSRVQTDNAWGGTSGSDKPETVARFEARFQAMAGAADTTAQTITFLEKLAARK